LLGNKGDARASKILLESEKIIALTQLKSEIVLIVRIIAQASTEKTEDSTACE